MTKDVENKAAYQQEVSVDVLKKDTEVTVLAVEETGHKVTRQMVCCGAPYREQPKEEDVKGSRLYSSFFHFRSFVSGHQSDFLCQISKKVAVHILV